MSEITHSFLANKLIFTKNRIYEIGGGKKIVKSYSKEFETRFFTLGVRLAFAKLRQAFKIDLILHGFDLKYHI